MVAVSSAAYSLPLRSPPEFKFMRCRAASIVAFLLACLTFSNVASAQPAADPKADANRNLFAADNLVAWCIVPFDAKRRSPDERAAMLKELGLRKFAYDWRAEHIPTFDAEIAALKKQGIELTGFWFPGGLNGEAEAILAALKRNNVKTQLWVSFGDPAPQSNDQATKVAAGAELVRPIADAAAKIGCSVGLYNHGGWFGEPENQLAVIEQLKLPNVGIVYNQHHGHDHLDRFAQILPKLLPHLYCLNLNGMQPDGERRGQKILPLGQGELDLALLKTIRDSGYQGPIGILGHTQDDARERLQDNLDGLAWLTKQLRGEAAGPRPMPRTPVPTLAPVGAAATAETAGWIVVGREEYRQPPLVASCRFKLKARDNFNILIANDSKRSSRHWELFSWTGTGMLTAYLPGYSPDHVRSEAQIVDGEWHEAAMHFQAERVRLYCDGKLVADQQVKPTGAAAANGELGIGRLAEGGIGCNGQIAWVELATTNRTVREPSDHPPTADDDTLGLWIFDDPAATESADRSQRQNPAKRIGAARTEDASQAATKAPAVIAYDAATVAHLATAAAEHGDVQRGRLVFQSAQFACLSCHKVGSVGGSVGPELTNVGKQLKAEQIVEAVVWPKRQVKPEFIAWQALTADGRQHAGYKLRETDAELVLRDPSTGAETTLAHDDIEALRETGTLMPDGLAGAMTDDQRSDLLRFLGELGVRPGLAEQVRPPSMIAATFPLERGPLQPEFSPAWQHPVNRARLYDFYSKEAAFFQQNPETHLLLPAFPGLDGGTMGHWGNQNEQVWTDNRWNDVDVGNLLSGVFNGGVTVPKGICVRLGDRGELSVCFNPETLTYDALWRGGFLKFSDVRHGFMHGLTPAGALLPRPSMAKPEQPFTYQGFHRSGNRVAFAYRIGDVDWLDAPWIDANGQFTHEVAPRASHSLRAIVSGGQSQWPQQFEVQGTLGATQPYAVDTIPFPSETPWKSLFFFGGHAFDADGSALLCTMHGDVWRVTGLDDSLQHVRWRRFASGLHQALGIVVADDEIYVLGRDQITRLHDTNHDGEADFYENFSSSMLTSPAGHDFMCGLERDEQGRFYTASGKQGLIRIAADGKQVEVLATGFRNPNGLGLLADGAVTVPCSEGDWTPASMLCLFKPVASQPPPYFGYPGPRDGKRPELPLVYFPRGLDNSCGGQIAIADNRWAPATGQLVHFSNGLGNYFLVLRDEVNGQAQGAIVPMPGEFRSGAHRGRFHPLDGQLYVTGMGGWGTYTVADGSFQRVRRTTDHVQLPIGIHTHQNGIKLTFSQPLDPAIVGDVRNHFGQAWNYRYSSGYGSPELSPSHPGAKGHDPLTIAAAHLLADGKSLFLELPDLQPVNQLQLAIKLSDGLPQQIFATIHQLDEPFTDLPNYQPSPKTIAAHPILFDLALLTKMKPNPWRAKLPNPQIIKVEAGKNLSFLPRELKAQAGRPIALTFTNPDVVPHNWVLIKPGALQRIGQLTNQLVADPDSVARHYVPESDDVLAFTDIVPAEGAMTIYFQAPKEKGIYPFLCTFPGHWMVMNGELVVE